MGKDFNQSLVNEARLFRICLTAHFGNLGLQTSHVRSAKIEAGHSASQQEGRSDPSSDNKSGALADA